MSSWRYVSNWKFKNYRFKGGLTWAPPGLQELVCVKIDPAQVVRHTLRHTAVSHLVQSGVNLPTVKRISEHKTLQMGERYAHQNGEHIRAAMDKLQSRMPGG